MRSALLLSLLLGRATTGSAQYPANDSAAVARQQWRVAVERLRLGDSTAALAALTRAAEAWPSQPAYHSALARLAGRLGRTVLAVRALDRLTMLGAAWASGDPAFDPIRADPRFFAAEAQMTEATAATERSRVVWILPDTAMGIEGVAVDSVSGRWFASSVRTGRVVVRERNGSVRDFITAGQDGLDSTYGLAVDHRRGLLWAASSALFAFDLRSGRLRAKVELPPVDGGHQLGDVIVSPHGTLFTSDSRYPALYRIPPGALPKVAEVVVEGHPLFRSLQGMVPSADERALFLADYSHGLLRIDLVTGAVTSLRPTAAGPTLGIDGLADGGAGRLIAIQNGVSPARVLAIDLDPAGDAVQRVEVIDRPHFGSGEATLGVRVGGSFVYVGTLPPVLRSLDLAPR